MEVYEESKISYKKLTTFILYEQLLSCILGETERERGQRREGDADRDRLRSREGQLRLEDGLGSM